MDIWNKEIFTNSKYFVFLDVPYFSKTIPSAENICIYIYDILRDNIDSQFKLSVRLYETPRNFVEYSG